MSSSSTATAILNKGSLLRSLSAISATIEPTLCDLIVDNNSVDQLYNSFSAKNFSIMTTSDDIQLNIPDSFVTINRCTYLMSEKPHKVIDETGGRVPAAIRFVLPKSTIVSIKNVPISIASDMAVELIPRKADNKVSVPVIVPKGVQLANVELAGDSYCIIGTETIHKIRNEGSIIVNPNNVNTFIEAFIVPEKATVNTTAEVKAPV